MKQIFVSGSMDNLKSGQVRFLEEAARLGPVHVWLWSDATVRRITGAEPMFLQEERRYFVESIRYVDQVSLLDDQYGPDALLPLRQAASRTAWVVPEKEHTLAKQAFCRSAGQEYQVIPEKRLAGFPTLEAAGRPDPDGAPREKVVVTGCYDWLHTGHVRFFEEAAQLGELTVVVGHDANVRLLKGEGHPLFAQDERRYMVQAIRFVTQALISSGMGRMDAVPEIARIQPDIYVVNEDGDGPDKQAFCAEQGLRYVVLKRLPKEGLPRRESTRLRGF